MDFLLSRQPVFGSSVNVLGYEIRSKTLETPNAPSDFSRTIYSMLTDDVLAQVVGQHPCIVELTYQGLAKGWWKNVAHKTVLGYFGPVAPDSPVAEELVKLSQGGARLLLEGTLPPETLDLLGRSAYAVKLDVTSFKPDDLKKQLGTLRQYKAPVLASKVDTHDDLEYCRSLGFDLYQGQFVSRSAAKEDTDVPVNRLTMMRILAKLQDPETPIPELEKTVSLDAALSYKLLAFANSAALALPGKVNSIGHAVRMVGINMLRNWASVLLLSSVDDKPRELMTIALVRARMCESLSGSLKNAQKDSFFSTGLLSVIDALLDCSMEKAVAKLPLAEEVQAALIRREGPAGQALRCAMAYERADWDNIEFNGMAPGAVRDIYMESIEWARKISTGLLS
jgi:EAL and modified HD-GYP domain-containing signal transduction protein